MSDAEDSGPGRREVAHRLFAAEFDDADFSYSESDEERAPNYVVTPTGARVNRLFVVGVLTELEQVNEEVLRARIVDPTGPFVVYAGQYQPEALAFLEASTPPLFVAVTGKARTFEPDDGDRVFTSIRPESISEVDADTRDRWVVQAAEQTIDRVGQMASAKQSPLSGAGLRDALLDAGVEESAAAGITLALDHYGTTGDYLQAIRTLAVDSARVVAGERDEAGRLSLEPSDGTDDPLATLSTHSLDVSSEDDVRVDETSATEPSTAPTDSKTAESNASDDTVVADDTDYSVNEPATTSDQTQSEPAGTDTTSDPASSEPTEPEPESVSSEPADDDLGVSEPDIDSEETDISPSSTSDPVTDADPTDTDEGTAGELGDFETSETPDADGTDDSDDVGEFDTEFELDDDEREEIQQEYGTDFQSGTEVQDPGEADIETPDPEDIAQTQPDETTTDSETAVEEPAETAQPDEDVDLEDAVMDVMQELDDGAGADREAVTAAVVEAYGADPDAVDDAIQDALMGGRCYEPDDGKLTPI